VSVGAVSDLPLGGGEEIDQFSVEGAPAPKTLNDTPLADFRFVDDGYFKTLEIPFIAGRAFTAYDNETAPQVVIINESLARRHFNGEDPVGKRLKAGSLQDEAPWATIVGVVKDTKPRALDSDSVAEMYMPFDQQPEPFMSLMIRTTGKPEALAAAVRSEVQTLDKNQPIYSIRTLSSVLSESVATPRFRTFLLGVFAAIALILAVVGIYGVMSYSVSQRTHEIGIRMALGAQTGDVLKLVVRHGMALTLTGIAIGLATSFALTWLMSVLLFGVSATDPLTFAVIAIVLTVVALAACFVPARRAAKVDPMVALRYE